MPPEKNQNPPIEPKVTRLERGRLDESTANERQHNFSDGTILAKEALIKQAQDNSATMKNSREAQDIVNGGN